MLARTPSLQKRNEKQYFDMLQLEAKLNSDYGQAIKDYQEGLQLDIKALPPQKPDAEQLLQDMVYQKTLFLQNADSIMNTNESKKLLDRYSNNDNTIRWFNQFFKEIEKRLSGKNKDILTNQYVFDFVKELKNKLGDIGITDLTADQIEQIVKRPEDIEPPAGQNEPAQNSVLPNQNEFLIPARTQQNWNRQANPYPRNNVANRRRHDLTNWLLLWTKSSILKWIASFIPRQRYNNVFGASKTNLGKMTSNDLLTAIVDGFTNPGRNYYVEGPAQGFGINSSNKKYSIAGRQSRKIGRGIEPSYSNKYKQFGKFIIHIPSLKKGILNIKFKSQASIPKIPQTYISQECMEFLLQLLENIFNKKEFNKLNEKEQNLLTKIFNMADLDDKLEIEPKINQLERDNENVMTRFNMLKAEIISGNNAPQLLKELEDYIYMFLKEGKMNENEGNSLLLDLEKIKNIK